MVRLVDRHIILFYIRLFAQMYRQAENLYVIFNCDTTAVTVENDTNNLETIVQSSTFNSV
jgi:hypothetical protein